MAYRGIAPKPDEERSRRNEPIYSRLPVKWDGKIRGPALSSKREWCEETLEWWEMFRRTPQSMVCTKTDWAFLQDTALLHQRIHDPEKPPADSSFATLLGEFRRRMSSYGYIFEDRLKLRMEIDSPAKEAAEEAEIEQAAEKAVNYAQRLAEKAAKIKE